MTNTTCRVPECGKPVKRSGFCYGHYMKNWRYGTPTPQHAPRWVDVRGKQFGLLTPLEHANGQWLCRCECGVETTVRAGDLNRGTVTTCGDRVTHWRRDDIGYSMAHERVRADRGLVQEHDCVNCGRAAEHWSYNHDDQDERLALGLSAKPVAYSVKPEHYSPRCVRCHKRFDLGRIDAARVA